MVSRPAKKVRTVCLSTLNWQNTFRFQVQTVTTPETMKNKMLPVAAERTFEIELNIWVGWGSNPQPTP